MKNHVDSIHQVSLGPNGEWFIIFEDGNFHGGNWDDNIVQQVSELDLHDSYVRSMTFGSSNSYVIQYGFHGGPF